MFELGSWIMAECKRILDAESEVLEEQARAIPAEQRYLYEIRIRVHPDGTRTRSLERKDAPRLPCECDRCKRSDLESRWFPYNTLGRRPGS